MKRILITFIVILVGFNSFAQLKLERWSHTELDSLIQKIIVNNDNIGKYQKIDYWFDDGYHANVIIFEDHEGYFLDVVYITRYRPKSNIIVENNGRHIFDHMSKRKLLDFNTNLDDIYKLIFDNGSHIKLVFDYLDSDGKRCRIFGTDTGTGLIGQYNWNY